jgi:hypothetical protein
MNTPPGRYRHFKGRDYEVLGVALHSETDETLVVYRPLYGSYRLMVRPQAMFHALVERDGVRTPRFAYLGATTMKKLTPHQWNAARDYLLHQARPLEAARYRFHFEQGSASEVLAALAAYQNDDGGFGRALEPDLRTLASSALATSVALQVLEEVHAPASHPLVQEALAYLLASYDSATQRWRIIPPEAEDAPRAFWWMAEGLEDRFAHFWLNPRAELLGALWRYAGATRVPWLAAVTETVVCAIEARTAPLAGNDLHCVLRLAATPQTPDALRIRLAAPLQQDIEATVVTAPERWGEYVLRPLEVAPTPDAPYAALFPAALQANLDYLIETQGDDGAWSPTWSWAPLDAAAWRKAEREWKGVLTLAALRDAEAWGRVAR